MTHLSGTDRSQLLLMPEAVDDYVGPDNLVRFIEAFVDGLDLNAAGFIQVGAKQTGRSSFDPADTSLKGARFGLLSESKSGILGSYRARETAAFRSPPPCKETQVQG